MKFEYLREFEPEFEKVLGYELGAHMESIHEKNQRPKISCYCTFKEDKYDIWRNKRGEGNMKEKEEIGNKKGNVRKRRKMN